MFDRRTQIERDLAHFAELSAQLAMPGPGSSRRITMPGGTLTQLIESNHESTLGQALAKIKVDWKAGELVTLGIFRPLRGPATIHRCTSIHPDDGTQCDTCDELWHDERIAELRAERGRWMTVDDRGSVSRHRSLREARALARQHTEIGVHTHVRRYRRERAPINHVREERIAAPRWWAR